MPISLMSATTQLKELLQIRVPGFVSAISSNQSGAQFGAMSGLNDLNTCMPSNPTGVRHPLPNNRTIRVDSSSSKSLFGITAPRVAIEGHESNNPDFTKIERLVDYNWELSGTCNWIAVNNRKPWIAYVLNRRAVLSPKASNVSLNGAAGSQMIRIMNYETRTRCLARGVFPETIADLSFAINSISSNSLDISKLAVADVTGNVYIYSVKEENGEINAQQVLAIQNDGRKFERVRLAWCPYIPSDEDDAPVEGDPGLTLALSCDTRIEVFAIDLLQSKYKETIVVEISALRGSNDGYQLIENAHDRPINQLSIAQEVTAICTTGLDDKIRFYSVALSQAQKMNLAKVFLKEWDVRSEYQYHEMDDHINNFFFLDDFDSLLSQIDPTFWGYGLLCTRKGHVAIVDLKDWRCKQTIKLMIEDSAETESFSYKIDLTAHHVLATKGHEAFLLDIHFPNDKEEIYDDCDPVNNIGPAFDNSYPYVSKVTRFQLYSCPLRSFAVKKAVDDNHVLLFWITGQSLELCHIDLSSIVIEEGYPTAIPYDMGSDKMVGNIGDAAATPYNMNTATNIPNKDLMSSMISNGYDMFGISPNQPPTTAAEPIAPPIALPIHKTPEPEMSALNLPPPPPKFTQSIAESGIRDLISSNGDEIVGIPVGSAFAMPPLPRPESPASKEVAQIFNPMTTPSTSVKNEFSLQKLFAKPFGGDSLPPMPDIGGALFPSKLPSFLNDMVREEQILKMKTDLSKDIQDSESRVLRLVERMEQKLNLKLNANNEQVLNNSKVQTNKIEGDIREMKKELKNACKIRNEEFNKIVEKLVNKVMHDMNQMVSKGFTDLMASVNTEFKRLTTDYEKRMQTMETKITAAADKSTHFQPLSVPVATPVTPSTPMTPQNPHQQHSYTPSLSVQRKTPQLSIAALMSTPQSAASTPVPFAASRAYQTPSEVDLPLVAGQSMVKPSVPSPSWQMSNSSYNAVANAINDQKQQQLLKQKQKRETENQIMVCLGGGQLKEALIKALNMRDPEMVVKICELFKSNPSQLIEPIASDQTVLISLLQQIIYNRNNSLSEDSYWKSGYVEQIVQKLDFQNECVIKILPALAPKIVQLLDVIANSATDPTMASKARILAFTFKHLKL